MYLELWDCPRNRVLVEAFYRDADGSFEFTQYQENVPGEVLAWFEQEARKWLPPIQP